MKKQIAVLLTCHNRCNKTIACLKALFNVILPVEYSLEVFLVDDGSTDGTGKNVKKLFAEVNVIQGNGNLFWTRGMHLAWELASKTKDFDYYLWLNDDTIIEPNGVIELILASESRHNKSIICASISSLDKNAFTYGGRKLIFKKDIKIIPNGNLQICDLINGNCVLIPRFVFKIVGNFDPTFHHSIGDFDYGLRAKNLNIESFCTGTYLASCDVNPTMPIWCLPHIPLIKRLNNLYSPLANSQPILYFKYEYRHWGFLIAIKHFISIHIRALFPSLWTVK